MRTVTIVFFAALFLGFNLYSPALSGPFVFDDFTCHISAP
jgi:hypothetical protein